MIDPKVHRLALEILRQHTSTFMTMLEAVKIARQLIRDQVTKEEVLSRFCKLSDQVMTEVFKCNIPADCFCSTCDTEALIFNFQFSEQIIRFIETAVGDRIREIKRTNSGEQP